MNITKYSFGRSHICIVINEKVQCVGWGGWYQLGNAERIRVREKFASAHVWDTYTIDAVQCIRDKTYVISNGKVYYVGIAWVGTSEMWQLKSRPFQIQELENIVAIKGGMNLVCALNQAGALFCWWGDLPSYDAENDQLYNGFSNTPRLIVGPPNDEKRVFQFAVADETVCYYMLDQTIQCIGNNDADQLGGLVYPTDIGKVKELVAGRYHFCALLESEQVYCWGGAGDESDNIDSTMPNPTFMIDNIQEVTASFNTTFARKNDGTLYGWGRNSLHQIQFPDSSYRSIPIPAASSDMIPYTDVYSYHLTYASAHAILKDGRIASWGSNIYGTVGRDDNDWTLLPNVVFMDFGEESSSRPTSSVRPTHSPSVHSSISPSSMPSISRKSYTPTTSSPTTNTPTTSSPTINTGISKYSFGPYHICIVFEGKVRCVGHGKYYVLGDEEIFSQRNQFISAHVWDSYQIDAILCVGSKTCVISEGKVYCIGRNVVRRKYVGYTTVGVETLSSPFLIREIDNIIEVDGGDDIVCGLQRGGAFFCWGILPYKASNGQMYESNTDPPKMILDGTDLATKVAHFAVADDAVCYFKENKNTQCFGKTQHGELGGLVDPTYIGEVSKLVAGAYHFCALLENGNLLCWGTMGDNLKITTPTLIMTEVADISTSSSKIYDVGNVASITSTSFARKNNGTLYGWGDNIWNQFGTCETKFRQTPAQVNLLEIPSEEVKSYHLTDRTSHAILKDGRIAAWGMNWYNTLGDGESNRFTRVVSPPTFMNLFYQDTPLPTSIPFSCPATDRPTFRPSFAPPLSPTTMSPTISSSETTFTMFPTIGESKMFSLTTIVIPSVVVAFILIVGCATYYQRKDRRLQNHDPYEWNINPVRTEPGEIPTAFNITPTTPAIAVPVTNTVHATAIVVDTNDATTSYPIPSATTLSIHPIPSAPPLESA